MSRRTTPPFRADHVGSLLRPPLLLEARADHAEGRIDTAALRDVEDKAITDVVQMQSDAGLQTVTDGEFRRTSWHMDFIYAIDGIAMTDERLTVSFSNAEGGLSFEASGLTVASPLRLGRTIFGDDFAFLRDTLRASGTGATAKLTIPSPSMVHFRGGPASIDPVVYPDVEQYWADLAAVYAEQIARLSDLGCTYLQLDDISLAYLNDPRQQQRLIDRGEDPGQILTRYIDTMNAAITDRPESMRITTHMCRGNFRSSWAAQGDYSFVAEQLLSELQVDGFFMEFDDERSGGFEPLRHLPADKLVVLGLITTKTPQLEDPDDLMRRLEDAGRFVDLDQVCLSPQCGFSSTVDGNDLTLEEQRAKLELIVSTAAEFWGE